MWLVEILTVVANYEPVLLCLPIAVHDSPGLALEKQLPSSVLNSLFVGELFAQAPIDQYPGIAVETVTDSSRYFVIRIQDGTGRSAFIGIGFTDRGDAFDFNVSLQDHFKWVKQETEISKETLEADTRPKLDLGFKEGQTIKLNIGVRSPVDPASFLDIPVDNLSHLSSHFYIEHDNKERRSSQASCVWIRGPKSAATSAGRQNCSPFDPSYFFCIHCQPCHTTTHAEVQ
uniref:Adaptin ear-binding coat-associated protein 1 n=1 Tax=Pavo cristatus TaxID=9049 RepID=A0A8C9LCZ4_PAVCR